MSKKAEYGIAALILVIGIVVSALILLLPKQSSGKTADADLRETQNDSSSLIYTVRFYDNGGELLESREVREAGSILPPQYIPQSGILKGWDHSLSKVYSDMDVYPITVTTDNVINALYAHVVYTEGDDPICLTLMFDGTVDCNSALIKVDYDPAFLQFDKAESLIDGIEVSDSSEPGGVTLSYNGTRLSGQTALCRLSFSGIADLTYQTAVSLAAKEILTEKEGQQHYTDCTAFPVQIYHFSK